MKRLLSFSLICALMCALLLTGVSATAEDSGYTGIEDSVLASLVANGFTAGSVTETDETRAYVAVFAMIDFMKVEPDYQFDFLQPIYVARQGELLTAAFSGQDEYIVILTDMTQNTMYARYKLTSSLVETVLEGTCETVWEVPLSTLITIMQENAGN